MKPGIETTEIWGGISVVFSALIPILTSGNPTVQCFAITAITIICYAYINSRKAIKCAHIEATGTVKPTVS